MLLSRYYILIKLRWQLWLRQQRKRTNERTNE